MPARKRGIAEVESEIQQDAGQEPPQHPLLRKLRNMWELANLAQYIFLFGSVVKISKDIDIETIELECCRPSPSEVLPQIGLALLKFVSSHRGLTPDLFDEYTRRQYDSKAPHRENPFGQDEEPRKFNEFDVFTKIRILHQLSVWTLYNPDRIRQALAGESERDWYIEPFGWDSQDRIYYSLDDNRLYRMTDPSIPLEPPKKKITPKKKPPPPKSKGWRSSKRQKLSNGDAADEDAEDADESAAPTEDNNESPPEEEDKGLGLGGAKWECVAITLKEYTEFTKSISKSRDPNEKELHKRMVEEMLPVIEQFAAAQERKAAQRRRDLENLERLATAKRSSRIADKHEKLKEQQDAEEAERKRQQELAMARKEEEKQRKMEEARESRMVTRENRLKDREMKRILREEELANLESQSQSGDGAEGRISERRRQNELDKKKRELEELNDEEEEWYFDCSICGVHGKNLDDGTHVLACEKCNVWQHSACHGIKEEEADSDDFHFVCSSCKKPPRPIKLNMTSSNPASPEVKRKKKKAEKQKDQANGVPTTEAKKRKKPAKSQHAYLNGSSPRTDSLFGSSAQRNPSALNDNERRVFQSQSGNYIPTQGYFPPPLSSSSYRVIDQSPYRQAPIRSPTRAVYGSFGSFSHTKPTFSPQSSQANDTQPKNASNVIWQNDQQQPKSPSQQRASHDPFLNDFARQRVSPYPMSSPQPVSGAQKFSPHPQSSQGVFQTPHAGPLPSIGGSPTPSFSATQGNTNIRFSPSQDASNLPYNFGSSRTPSANSYMPEINRVNVSAVSPVKQSSSPPPPLPQASSQNNDGALTRATVPTFPSPPTQSTAGLSPVKHETAPTARPPSAHGLGVTGLAETELGRMAQVDTPTQSHRRSTSETEIRQMHSDTNMRLDVNANHGPNNIVTNPSSAAPTFVPNAAVVEEATHDRSSQIPQKSPNQPTLEPVHVESLPPAPTLSPNVGLSGRLDPPQKKSPPLAPAQPHLSPKSDSISDGAILPLGPTLSPNMPKPNLESLTTSSAPKQEMPAQHTFRPLHEEADVATDNGTAISQHSITTNGPSEQKSESVVSTIPAPAFTATADKTSDETRNID